MKHFIATFWAVLACLVAAAQTDLPQVFSPNAAELGKYGKIPVSYFNGLPNITIPLTELRAKNYTLPIYLTYHAGGNKPDQHPGWVGLGWTLHAGGCINRVVKGLRDEMSIAEYSALFGDTPNRHPGYYYNPTFVQENQWESQNLNAPDLDLPRRDCEPDEFMVSMDDLQFSFHIAGPDSICIVSKNAEVADVKLTLHREWAKEESAPLPIYICPDNELNSLYGKRFYYFEEIVVTRSDGRRYVFGDSEETMEFVTQILPQYGFDSVMNKRVNENDWYAVSTVSTWLLDRIEFPDGECIRFFYEKDGKPIVRQDYHHAEYFHISLLPSLDPFGFFPDVDDDWHHPHYDTHETSDIRLQNISFSLLQPSYLVHMECQLSGSSLDFTSVPSTEMKYNTTREEFEWRAGDYSGDNSEGISYDEIMSWDYYKQLQEIAGSRDTVRLFYSDSNNIRLHLDSLQYHAADACPQKYSFHYNATSLPPYHSRQTDCYGYYNGKNYYSIPWEAMTAFRTPDEEKMKAEILVSIDYPTGGRSEFDYEAHRYSKVAEQYPFRITECPSDSLAGGLRIKEIRHYERDGVLSGRQRFTYLSGERSSGILSGRPVNYLRGNHTTGNGCGDQVVNQYDGIYELFSELPLRPLSDTDGNHVTYSRVQEIQADGSVSEYQYSNHDTEGGMDSSPLLLCETLEDHLLVNPFNSKSLSRGNLILKEDRKAGGGLVRREEYVYASDTTEALVAVHHTSILNDWISTSSIYKIYTYFPKLEKTIVTTYPDNPGVIHMETTDYTYDSHRNLTSETRTSGDQTVRDDYTYPGNYPNIPVYADMSASGRHALPVEHVRSVDGAVSEAELVTWKQAGAPGDYVPSERFKATPTGLPDSTTLYDGITVNGAYGPPLVSYLDYDAHSNLTQSVTPDGSHTSYTWDRDSTHLRGIFVGAERKERSRIWSEQARVTEEEDLSDLHDRFYGNSFTTVADGPVTVNIWFDAGDERDIWGRFDGDSLLSFHCPVPTSTGGITPIYTCTFQLPAGQHFLSLSTREGVFLPVIPVLHSPGATGVVGDHPGHDPLDPVVIIDPNGKLLRGYLSLTYWGDADYVRVRDEAECAHFSFEDTGDTEDGFQSTKSQTAETTVHLVLNPDRTYTMDRRVKRNGEWVYERMPFGVNTTDTYTLHACGAPFDEVRIYADGVQPETYTWWPDGNLRSRTDARGVTESYVYDGLGRLTGVYDNEGNKVEGYQYNYKNR